MVEGKGIYHPDFNSAYPVKFYTCSHPLNPILLRKLQKQEI